MKKEIREELEKRVRYVVNLSKEIPWYDKKYKELEIDPDEIRKPEDLFRAYEKGLYTTPVDLPELVYYKHPEAKGPFYTSGTTGKPKEIWVNPDDEKRVTIQAIEVYSLSFKENDRILNCFPAPPAVSGYMANLGLLEKGYNFKHFPAQKIREDINGFLNVFKEFNPTGIMGLTTFLYRLPLLLKQKNISSNLQSILVSAEPSTIERRKTIGEELNGDVYDLYCSSENCVIAYEDSPFKNEYKVTLPSTFLFLVGDDNLPVDVGEIGYVVVSNLFEIGSKPYFVILNYKIGDWAKCMDRDEDIVTSIGEIRREAASLAGAKLNPQEVEKCIEELRELKDKLSGEYCIINYYDEERKAVGEVRVEAKTYLPLEEKRMISEKLREKIYSINIPIKTLVEIIKDAKLLIEVTDPGELYKGYEQYIKPGKPKRLLRLGDV